MYENSDFYHWGPFSLVAKFINFAVMFFHVHSPVVSQFAYVVNFSLVSLIKEVAYYEKEVQENESKLENMKQENCDPYDIKKFEEVLGESYMMVPDSKGRLERAIEDLASYVESDEVDDLKSGEWYKTAQELLQSESAKLKMSEGDTVEETPLDDLKDGEAF